jgi:multiple sugar transport system substrate-binding protein
VQVTIDPEALEGPAPEDGGGGHLGSGPDIGLGWLDNPHQFPDKRVDLTGVVKYLGET